MRPEIGVGSPAQVRAAGARLAHCGRRSRKSGLRLVFAAFAGLIAAVLLFIIPRDYRIVVQPLLVISAVLATFYAIVGRRSRLFPVDDIAVWATGITAAYAVFPMLVYLGQGLRFTALNSARLYLLRPDPATVANIGWFYAIYLSALVGAYLGIRGGDLSYVAPKARMPRSLVAALILVWLILTLSIAALKTAYGIDPAQYLDTYRLYWNMPLPARQLVRLMVGVRLVASIGLLIWLFCNYRVGRWVYLSVLAIILIANVVTPGARTNLMIVVVAGVVLYHRYVRPINFVLAAVGSSVAILLFMGLGIWRQVQTADDPRIVLSGVNAGEFESIFANALDIESRIKTGGMEVRPTGFAYWEFTAAVPSQLLPFEKQDMAGWYMLRYHPDFKSMGGGYAFGVVAQSILGLGKREIALRGILVGIILALIARWFRKRQASFWVAVGYIWLLVLVYQTVRASTFYLLGLFVQQFLPTLLVVEVIRRLLSASRRHV